MKWLGLTGGIASGKSTVSNLLRSKGVAIVDADEVAKSVVAPGTLGLAQVVQEFGPGVLASDDSLDRKKLGQIVFGDPTKLSRLESILHPMVQDEVARQRHQLAARGLKYAVYDVPLLFEKNLQSLFDAIILVYSTPEQQSQRLRDHRGHSDDEVEKRMNAQISIEEKKQRSDFVVKNDLDLDHLKREVEMLYQWLEKL